MTKGQRSNRETEDYILKIKRFPLLEMQKIFASMNFVVFAIVRFPKSLVNLEKIRHNSRIKHDSR